MIKPEVSVRIVEALKSAPMTKAQMVVAISAGKESVREALQRLESMGVVRRVGRARVYPCGPQSVLWERGMANFAGKPSRSASSNRPVISAASIQSRPDGNYALCKHCEKMGYGEDAWQPATAEFWPTENRRLNYDRCRACISEMKVNAHGVVPGRVAA